MVEFFAAPIEVVMSRDAPAAGRSRSFKPPMTGSLAPDATAQAIGIRECWPLS